MEDQAILLLFNERREEAIDECRRKYGSYCHAIANRILASREDAEECLNDTLLRAWNSIPPDQPASLASYLGAITRHLSLDRYRRRSTKRKGGGEVELALSEIEMIFATEDDPAKKTEENELKALLNAFLKTLPARDRTILVCRYFHFYSIHEIAKKCAMKEKTVYALLSRTLEKLKEYLKKENYV